MGKWMKNKTKTKPAWMNEWMKNGHEMDDKLTDQVILGTSSIHTLYWVSRMIK
jgi:hypothetical protein